MKKRDETQRKSLCDVIRALEICMGNEGCKGCPYAGEDGFPGPCLEGENEVDRDALYYLKAYARAQRREE